MSFEKHKYLYDGINTNAELFPVVGSPELDAVRETLIAEGANPHRLFVALLRPKVHVLSTALAKYGHDGKYNYDVYGNSAPGVSFMERLSIDDLKDRLSRGERHFNNNVVTNIDYETNALNNKVFSNVDFSYCVFLECGFTNSAFPMAVLRNATFINCALNNTDFVTSDLRGTVFSVEEDSLHKMMPMLSGSVVTEDNVFPEGYDLESEGVILWSDMGTGDPHCDMVFELEHHRAAQPYFMLKTRLHSDLVDRGKFDIKQFFEENTIDAARNELSNAKILRQHVSSDADVSPYIDKYIEWYDRFLRENT